MKTKYPYDKLQKVGDSFEFTSDKPLAHVQEAFRQYGKRHNMKFKVSCVDIGPILTWFFAERVA